MVRSVIFTLAVAIFTLLSSSAQDTGEFQNQAPEVDFIYPTNNLVLFSPTSLHIRAHASDPDGQIRQVRLLVNGSAVAADLQAPYEFIFNPSAFGSIFGTYSLHLEATDSAGAIATSTSRLVQYVRINDHLTNNIPITVGTNLVFHAVNAEATHQKGEPQHAGVPGGKSVWFTWRATYSGTVVIDTEGSDFDTVLAVYTNRLQSQITSPTNLVEVAANNDDKPIAPLSRVKFAAFAHTTYYIAVDGKDGFAGNIRLNLLQERTTAPANDYLAHAARTFVGPSGLVASNVRGTKESGEPDHAGNPGGASVWFRADLPRGSRVRISTLGSNFDTLLAVYASRLPAQSAPNVPPAMEDLSLVVANDDLEGTNRTSEVSFIPEISTYWVAVDGYNGAEGTIRLTILPQSTQGTVPPNDRFTNATQLVGGSVLANVNTLSATTEAGEPPQQSGRNGGRSVWYRWVAPATGPVYLSTEWSSFDTMLSVFTGTNLLNLSLVGYNDDADGLSTSALVFHAVEGVEYRISVAGYLGAAGDMVLMLNQPQALLPRMITQFSDGRISLSVAQASGRMLLETSTDLAEWRPVRYILPGEEITDIEPSPDRPREFYRLLAVD